MAFEFAGYRKGGTDFLFQEERFKAVTSVALYVGQALKLSASRLCACTGTADLVYAISNVSVAAASVSADFIPKVYPVNANQIWKTSCTTALTAAACVRGTGLGMSTAIATAVMGDRLNSATFVYDFTTGGTPVSGGAPASAVYVVFLHRLLDPTHL
jgi:hypothetical protein